MHENFFYFSEMAMIYQYHYSVDVVNIAFRMLELHCGIKQRNGIGVQPEWQLKTQIFYTFHRQC